MSEGWDDIDVDWTGYPVNRVEGWNLIKGVEMQSTETF